MTTYNDLVQSVVANANEDAPGLADNGPHPETWSLFAYVYKCDHATSDESSACTDSSQEFGQGSGFAEPNTSVDIECKKS